MRLAGGGDKRGAIDPPFEVLAPHEQTLPFVFASPHSGRIYPKAFLQASRLDGTAIRRMRRTAIAVLRRRGNRHHDRRD